MSDPNPYKPILESCCFRSELDIYAREEEGNW